MNSVNRQVSEPTEQDTRPDWDPYAVWLTHIMKAPAEPESVESRPKPVAADKSWNPYTVWQSLIKN